MKIERIDSNPKVTIGKLCYGDVFEYDGNHMIKIRNNIEGRSFNAVRLVDGTLYGISDDALLKPLPNARLVIE
jgi:hypothetical protein